MPKNKDKYHETNMAKLVANKLSGRYGGTHLGYEYYIRFNDMGYRCGYVRIPKGHPLYEKHYMDEETYSLDVHGGITFSQHIAEGRWEGCAAGYWMGFDCAHAGDAPEPDEIPARHKEIMKEYPTPKGVVRSRAYVERQCRNLCQQLFELE